MTFSTDHDLAGTIARLFIHPIKSCAGIEVQEALLTDTGLAFDRSWMVVDLAGDFVTQRTLPRMALIQPRLTDAALEVTAPGMPALAVSLQAAGDTRTVCVWGDTVPAWDVGDDAAAWFSAFLGQPCRLVRFDPEQRRLSSLKWTGGFEAPNQFADGFPVLLTSQASIDGLNDRLHAAGQSAVGMERFRPNVVVDGVEAHDEDRIEMLYIDSGGAGAELQPVKPCARCPIPDIDPATAESTPHVSTALRGYRQDKRLDGAITFGMNAIVRTGTGQVLRVGQRVAADLRFE